MLKWSIFTKLTGFLCSYLPYIANNYECLGYYMPLYNDCTSSSFLVILWPWVKITVIHSGYQNIKFNHVYHQIKFERNWFVSVQTQEVNKLTAGLFSLNIGWTTQNEYEIQTNKSQQHDTLHPNPVITLGDHWHRSFCCLASLWLLIEVKVT